MFRLWKQLRTEYIQVWSVSKCLLLGEKKNPQKFFIIVISICFSYAGNVFRVIELEADENHSYFWKRQALLLRAQRLRGVQNNVRWGPDHPTLNVILRAPHSKISAMGPEFLATVSKFQAHPQFITWFLPPYSPFLTLTRLRSVSPHGGGRFTIGPLTNKSFFSRPYDACNDITRDQCQAWICHARRFFSKMFN